MSRVSDSLARVRSWADANRHLGHVQAAIAELEALLRYEEHRLARIRPKPSMLLRVLTEKEKQLLREQRPPAAARAVAGSPKMRPEPRSDAEADSRSVPRDLEQRPITVPRFDPAELDPNDWLSGGADDALLEEYLNRLNRKRPEKRREHRDQVNCPVHVDPGAIRGTVRDLSAGGLFLHTHTSFSHGPRSLVRLTLSTSNGPKQVRGVVHRVERGRSADRYQSRVRMGVEFNEPSGELKDYMSRDVPAPSAWAASE
jgi:hypothetical protein